ncbi:hypothetical protein GLOIN_2v1871739 [Rhizophagus irregularis DAOM 181602=DAOM 197198]|uniref:Uncharacterized protein n=1 Tax=Rhizophagus irregularis (strain DAOM 181602 / DAOM 197198 / MUCL 43194) TaxID=747089 RepID=A0A2P4QGZ7_RHIID|nr:hypothetical protein GLOIN_2v1871739 [Rhizophagus irregularis DAOM 181602=DAOM 197198]POG76915.1 hypothetical protein GLOIN_2v1871739 [Rhizophagus irregularis DAOM 181602=DAOM 197198]|eukprot:XP_025183781.1 hypothetical protein GLOIN_2v1871739 [Rhizophagus irregularis DAOM 181602=DAOM 197198]
MSRRQSPLVHRNIVMMDVKIEMVKGSDDEITVKEKGNTKFCISLRNVNSINELIKEFEDIVASESNLTINESIVALKHFSIGNYFNFRDVTNDLVINNGSIRNNEEIKDGELIFAELDTYLDEAKKNSYRTTPSKKLALGQLSS